MTYIGETLIELYAKFRINPEDMKTWKQEKQPTLLDLYDLWRGIRRDTRTMRP